MMCPVTRWSQVKRSHGCQLLSTGHPLMFLDGPADNICVSWRRFVRLHFQTDLYDLCDRQLRSGLEFTSRGQGNVCISQAPDFRLGEGTHSKHRRLVFAGHRVERLALHSPSRGGEVSTLAQEAGCDFVRAKLRRHSVVRDD